MMEVTLTEEEVTRIKSDPAIRRELAKKSHRWFFSIYLSHYIQYPFAPFHYQMFDLTEDINCNFSIVQAFRGSGKSTINTTSFPIWAIIGKLQKKMVVIISQTQDQAKAHFTNIKRELEENELLKSDIGPFEEFDNQWGAYSIFIPKFGAWIVAASTEQKIRGIRNGPTRPDLIIIDDPEDLNSTKTQESRDRLFDWFNAEVVPLGNQDTKIVILGNMLHEDSLEMRLIRLINQERLIGKVMIVPLIDASNQIAWPGKYPDMEAINKLRKSIPSDIAYYREYLLKILPTEDQVVQRAWMKFYKNLPNERLRLVAIGIDPAISERSIADYTAAVVAYVYSYGEDMRTYIGSALLNKRLNFPAALDEIKNLAAQVGQTLRPMVYVESIGMQGSLAQMLIQKGCAAEEVKLGGGDKRFRLSLTAPFIKSGKILFPEIGAEELITQLVGFEVERHNDLCDAFSLLINKIMQLDQETKGSTIFIGGSIFGGRGPDGKPYRSIMKRDMKF